MSIDFVDRNPHLSAGFYQSLVLSNEGDEGSVVEGEKARKSSCHSFGAHRNSLQCIQWPSVAQKEAQLPTESVSREENRFSAEPFVLEQFAGLNVVQVSCGGNHSAILEKRPGEEGGQVWVWGLGNGGRLGIPRPKKTSDVQEILKNSRASAEVVSSLMSNRAYIQSLTSDTKKWTLHTPVRVKFRSRIASISCGTDYTLALTEDGSIYAWGVGSYGNLGTGLICDQYEPALVEMPNKVLCRQVAAGTKHSMALSTGGDMYSWGHGGHGRLGHGACDAAMRPRKITLDTGESGSSNLRFKFVAVGEAHSASIDSLGQVWCWGAGSFGRCGHGEETDFLVPQVVASMIGKSCSQVALGVCHSLALSRGRIWSWGGFLYTGHGEDDDIEAARELDDEELKKHNIVEIAAGRFHSLALSSTGEVFSWGAGSLGRLGLGSSIAGDLKTSDQPTPMQILVDGNPLLGWQKLESKGQEKRGFVGENAQLQLIACGGMHSAAVEKDGSCWLWGHGEYGQNASAQLEDFWKPNLLCALDPISRMKIKVLSIALGMEHCLMISTNMELFSWGRNHRGQLGLGTTSDTSEPTFVAALAKASSVAAGEDHSAGITPGGEIYTWGNAECGKLGHGSSMIRSAMSFPKQINMETRVKKVNCGPLHTALIGNNGELLTFGAGWFGRLGHGDMNNQYSPKLVEHVLPDLASDLKTSPRFLEVTCGSFHTCAICEGSMLWVCGRDYLVCESDHITSPLLFNKIDDGSSAPEIVVAGANHTLCVTRSGNLWGWGDNSKGQLGLGGGTAQALPTLISCKGWRGRESVRDKPKEAETTESPTKAPTKAKAKIVETPELMGVACGYAHSMAVTDNGEVWAWGLQSGGRLALKAPFDGKFCPVPQKVHPSWKLVEKQPAGRAQ